MGCGSSTPQTNVVENPYNNRTKRENAPQWQNPGQQSDGVIGYRPPEQQQPASTKHQYQPPAPPASTPTREPRHPQPPTVRHHDSPPHPETVRTQNYSPRQGKKPAAPIVYQPPSGSGKNFTPGASIEYKPPYQPKPKNQSYTAPKQPVVVQTATVTAAAYQPPTHYTFAVAEAEEAKDAFDATNSQALEPVQPRLLRTRNPRQSIDPQLEKRVRTIQLKFDDVYFEGEQLGYGAFATVFAGTHISSKTEYAVKKIDRAKMYWNERDALEDEIKNLTLVREGPSIVQLFEVYEEGPSCFLVMEYLRGGELFDRIVLKTKYSEKEARDACRCILNGLDFMHKRRICHRDLKPENLLLVSRDDDTTLKLADFGFAKKLEKPNSCRTLCGTPGYLAPEILERYPAYDVTCDIWSVGVILFLLVGGYLPFDDDDDDQVFERTRNGTFTFHPTYFKAVSDEVKDLIGGMLTLNPYRRMNAAAALDSDWMKQGDEDLSKRNLTNNLGKMSESFRGKQKVQGAVATVIAADRLGQLSADFNNYLQKKGRRETVITHASEITKAAVIQDDESLTGKPFKTFYNVGKKLGEGGFAKVYHVTHKKTTKEYAVKDILHNSLDELGVVALKDEIEALKVLRNGPHIVRLYDVFEEPDHTFLVLELMKGGELLERIIHKEVYTEREARQVCKILFEAVDYMHKKQVVHRDLKPENLLLVKENNDTSIKIADFGFAKRATTKNGLKTLCGTPSYVAPEVIGLGSAGYGTQCDLWSAGVIVFVLLGGYLPFDGDFEEITPLILTGSYEFVAEYWSGISTSAKDLVRSLLQVDPDVRIDAEQALQSDWMTIAGAKLARRDLSIAQSQISTRFPMEKLKGAVKVVMATNKLSDLMGIPGAIDESVEELEEENDENEVEDSSSGKTFDQLYDWGGKLGEGSFSVVHASRQRQTGKEYAAKRVWRKLLDETDAVALKDEITALQAVKGNPHILEFHDVFEEPDFTFIVMEVFRGGNLIQRIIEKSSYYEEEARMVCRFLLEGVEYMHSKNIAHRNLKPDNFFLVSQESNTDVKICDFGFAKKVLYPNSLRTRCGTEGYVAPEILEHHPMYDRECDMWSLGVCFYILLGGYRPFRGSGDVLLRQIRYGEYTFHPKYWGNVSDEAMDLISSLLTVDPKQRATATQALRSPWMSLGEAPLEKTSLNSNLEELRSNFDPKATLRGAVKTVMFAQRFKNFF